MRAGESPYDVLQVRELCNFTTHTPVEAGHDKFAYDLVRRTLGDFVDVATLKALAGTEVLNMTCLALNLSDYVNGVAKRHAEVSEKLYPGYRVHAITNGVHPFTWTHASFAALYDVHLPGWCHESGILVRADSIPDAAIWQAHVQAKDHLMQKVKILSGVALDPTVPVLGFARRMTAYKRPDLLFSDISRLKSIAKKQPFQLILAGKAHPHDEGGKRLIEDIHKHMRELSGAVRIVFLPNYDLEIAMAMTAGVDIWLNTPLRPLEASGTSGMKAAFNGVPSLSVLDGWWIEGCIEGITGWSIGNAADSPNGGDADALYEKLDHVILPLYYNDNPGWVAVMKGAICKNASFFNSHRMMRRYATEAYLR